MCIPLYSHISYQLQPSFSNIKNRAAQQYKAIVPDHLAETALFIGVEIFEGLQLAPKR